MHKRSIQATIVILLFSALLLSFAPVRAADQIPAQLTDKEFWQLISDSSEPDGSFLSDNFVSNERSFQRVIADLAARGPADAYIGVGPEQNFTYLLGVKPKIAFIVDIRRQNMIEHLMYKALFELSKDRADFISKLFSQDRPQSLTESSTIEEILAAFEDKPTNSASFLETLQAVRKHLKTTHGFALDEKDEARLEYVLQAFATGHKNLSYSGPLYPRPPSSIMPSFEELMLEKDDKGGHTHFLSTEANFKAIQEMERKNLIVPIVGDFAGPKAIRSVGDYLKAHNATVSAFYTSNVEHYLFMNNSSAWRGFYTNVSKLPIDEESIFIRGLIQLPDGTFSSSPAMTLAYRYATRLFPIGKLVSDFKEGKIESYQDMLKSR